MQESGTGDLNRPRIEQGRCNGCGLCVGICPSDTLALRDGTAVPVKNTCFGCDHCAAICPADAIVVEGLSTGHLDLSTINTGGDRLPMKGTDAALLFHLMQTRRSCRSYLDEPVSRAVLEDLARVGLTAPSGTNSQCCTYTILPDRASLLCMGEAVGRFYERLNRLSANRAARLISKLFTGDRLGHYERRYRARVEDALRAWRETGRDRLFHGAPAAIVIASRPGASCPVEDALLSAQNILLAAHALGYGTCLIGFAVEAMRRDRSIQRSLGIPDDEEVHAVIAIGKPAVSWLRRAGRKSPVIRWAE